MSRDDLWGDMPEVDAVKTPYVILKEQGELLTEKTDGLLVGEISDKSSGSSFTFILKIVAPILNNYSYDLVEVAHPITLYPLNIRGSHTANYTRCDDEDNYKNELKIIFTSPRTQDVIAKLLTHVKSQ